LVRKKFCLIFLGETILFIYEEMTRTCVASEYGVVEFSSTSCEPNIGKSKLELSGESMMQIVSCLGTMLQMFINYFTCIVLQKYLSLRSKEHDGT